MVGIYSGSTQIKRIYAGGSFVKRVYHGSTLVFEALAKNTIVVNNSTGDASGSYTVKVPGPYKIWCVGGGGGCSLANPNATNAGYQYTAASGGGGGYAYAEFTFAEGDVLSWKVGNLGGNAGYGAQAGDGGKSYVKKGSTTLISANGGKGAYILGMTYAGGSGGTTSVNSAGANQTKQTGNAGAFVQTYTATAAAAKPAAAAARYSGKGKSSTGYCLSGNNPVWENGTAGLIKIQYVG